MVAHVGPSAWRQPRCRQPKQYHVRECASSGTAEVTSSYHCLEKSILPSDSPVGSTPIGDLSVVRVLRVCGWLYGRRRPVHDTPGRARGRRRWKLAECDAKERRRSNCPTLLCLFGVIAFASKLVGVWMSTLDESQPPGAARHASISCSLWELNYMRKRERERERETRESARARRSSGRWIGRTNFGCLSSVIAGAITSHRSCVLIFFAVTLSLPSDQNNIIPPLVPRVEASSFAHSQSSPTVGLLID